MDYYRIDRVHLDPKKQIGLHSQPSWELSYVITGAGRRIIGGVGRTFKSGDLVLVPPQISHQWIFGQDEVDDRGRISNITLIFSSEFLDNCSKVFNSIAPHLEKIQSLTDALVINSKSKAGIVDLLEQMSSLSEEQRPSLILRLLVKLSTAIDHADAVGARPELSRDRQRMEDIRTYVICNSSKSISIEDMALHLGMCRASFCRYFRQTFGTTFVAYLNNYRIEHACRLLRDDRLSVAETAFRAGFNDIPYFNRVFKKIMGTAPNVWRKLQDEDRDN